MCQGPETASDTYLNKNLHAADWKVDSGSTAVVSLIFIGALMLLLFAVSSATLLAHGTTRLQVIADSASLAAADTIRGLASGVPCENAELIAVSNGVFLDSCRIVGTDVSIGLTKFVGLSEISVDSVAGSPSD